MRTRLLILFAATLAVAYCSSARARIPKSLTANEAGSPVALDAVTPVTGTVRASKQLLAMPVDVPRHLL